jgi:hypothetical protein
MTSIDTNVSNYTLSELMAIVELTDLDHESIIKNTDKLIKRFKGKKPALSVFFQAIQSQLLQYADGLKDPNDDENEDGEYGDEEDDETVEKIIVEGFGTRSNEAIYPSGEKQVSDWYTNENLTQSDQNQVNKITDRKQKIQTFGNPHVTMNREQLGINDTYQVPVKQDSLNPNLKNTITRFVNLDSQFRQYTNGIDSTSTDYTLDLSDTLKDVLNMRIFSYQIPYSWYSLDVAYGNTCLWINDGSYNVVVSVSPGNYTSSQFITDLSNNFTTAGFYNYPTGGPVLYNQNSAKITLNLFGADFSGNITVGPSLVHHSFTVNETNKIIFYDFTGVLQCTNVCLSKTNHHFNNSLGWVMGFRVPYTYVDPSGNTAPCVLDLNGPKYLILVIDDYNQNHVNNGLVSITQFSSTLKMPSYFSPDLPYTCITPTSNLEQIVASANLQSVFDNQNSSTSNGLLIAGKYEGDYSSTPILLPSAPRTLTQSQIYTINEINKSRNNTTNYLSKAPTTSDILGILPIKVSGLSTGSLIVEFSGSVQENIRTYFGPVDIDRMCVKLLDDKGNILNLNGGDWCVTLICECLYQY